MKRVPSVKWRKSSYSDHSGGECVEIAGFESTVAVRDSRDQEGPSLAFSPTAWSSFTASIKSGTLDRP